MPSYRQEPFRAPKFRACQIIEELEQSKEAFTAVQSDMWILQETWMCALQSVWYIRKKMKSVSGREPESWQTAYRKKNLKECQNKARAVVRAISQAEEGLE